MKIKISEHFTYKKLFRFVLPTIFMMIFSSIYGVVDGLFISNFVGKTPFASINLIMPFIMILGGMGFMLGFVVTLISGCTNAALDALFIAGFRWGIAGAAVATGIGQVLGGIIPL